MYNFESIVLPRPRHGHFSANGLRMLHNMIIINIGSKTQDIYVLLRILSTLFSLLKRLAAIKILATYQILQIQMIYLLKLLCGIIIFLGIFLYSIEVDLHFLIIKMPILMLEYL